MATTKAGLRLARTHHMKRKYRMKDCVINVKDEVASIKNTDVLSGKHVAVPNPYGVGHAAEVVGFAVLDQCVEEMDLSKMRPLNAMQPRFFW